ncbi:MAG: hypothetical protein ETSY2_50810 [Candidatus Entotheonella gemina]|uniref:Uncharacterized protein n=1 Tax=Candidatus Entotheonella gemina TaxID=1429439 RepID=W4L6W4_9BACT|nr:MAG: hypothetical protein ETSY2_50810 [Candidatus Entotheonella gemina]
MSTPAGAVGTDVGASGVANDNRPELGGSDESAPAGSVRLTTAAGGCRGTAGQPRVTGVRGGLNGDAMTLTGAELAGRNAGRRGMTLGSDPMATAAVTAATQKKYIL